MERRTYNGLGRSRIMAFRSANLARLTKFNSSASSEFIDFYESCVDKEIEEDFSRPSHKSIAPSSIRCPRKTWFRLRGVQPDSSRSLDRVLKFTADIGTACHEFIQSRLANNLGDNWIDVESYLKEHPIKYDYEISKKGYETRVKINNPTIRFAVDGIIFWNDKYYLLEIKSSDFGPFDELMEPKPQHVDQVVCYSAILDIEDTLILYIDRQYGGLKCYEKIVKECDRIAMRNSFEELVHLADVHIAPEGLPKGDSWCSPNMCQYYKKCQQYGR